MKQVAFSEKAPDAFFAEDLQLVAQAAGLRYRALERGEDPSLVPGTSVIVAVPSQLDTQEAYDAKKRQAELNLAVRSTTRLAEIRDGIDAGGVQSIILRGEELLTRWMDRAYLGGRDGEVLRPGGLVDRIRGQGA